VGSVAIRNNPTLREARRVGHPASRLQIQSALRNAIRSAFSWAVKPMLKRLS
jgi:hypothetical protein